MTARPSSAGKRLSPTEVDLRAIRRLHKKAGSRHELDCWIDAALSEKPVRGRKRVQFDETPGTLLALEAYCRFAEVEAGLRRYALLRYFVSAPFLSYRDLNESGDIIVPEFGPMGLLFSHFFSEDGGTVSMVYAHHHPLLKLFASIPVRDKKTGNLNPLLGAGEDAVVRRLGRKLKARNFPEHEIADYFVKLGLDPRPYTTLPD
jgi:hypothetical protein